MTGMVAVAVLVFAGCFFAGVLVAARLLPDLERGTLGGLVFLLVCGMSGASAALVGMHIYLAVQQASESSGRVATVIVSSELTAMLWEVGVLLGIGAILYLLAQHLPGTAAPPVATAVPAEPAAGGSTSGAADKQPED